MYFGSDGITKKTNYHGSYLQGIAYQNVNKKIKTVILASSPYFRAEEPKPQVGPWFWSNGAGDT